MSFSVCFVQCQQRLQLPHMNMPLFVPDLETLGCRVECICLHVSQISRLTRILEGRRIDLLGIEHMAPYGIVRRVKALSPKTKIVVGGNGFLDMFAKTEVDFGIAGAGRKSLRALVTALQRKASLFDVPNLFFKQRCGDRVVIDCTANVTGLSLLQELRPYAPNVDWTYLGFSGPVPALCQRGAPPTTVADLGCPCRAKPREIGETPIDLGSARYPLADRARERLTGLYDQRISGGCSFCTYGTYAFAPLDETQDLLLEQMTYLQGKYGFDRFSIGSEAPFRFLLPLLRRALNQGIALRQIRIRSRVEWILRFENVLREAIELARKNRFQLAVWQVGFESFCDKHLAIYSKNQSVQENLEAVRVLEDLERQYSGWFATSVPSHGFLGNTAWTKIEDVEEQMRNIERLPRCWRRAILGGPVKLFDELLPYAQNVKRDKLLVRRKNTRDGFRFRDDRIRILERAREYYSHKIRKLADAFFWRAALDEYWQFLGKLLPRLKKRKKNAVNVELELSVARKTIDRKINPILNAYRFFNNGVRQEGREKIRGALKSYRKAKKIMPKNGVIDTALSRVAHALGDTPLARRYARTAVRLLEKECARHPEDPNIDLLLAQCLARIGEQQKSAVHLRTGFAKRRSFIVDEN